MEEPDIQTHPRGGGIPWGRLGTVVVALAVAVAGVAFATRAFLGEPKREQRQATSPTGKLAVVVIEDRYLGQGADSIHVVNQDGTGMERLMGGRAPAWSPDGTGIAFRRGNPNKGGGLKTTIYVTDADGTDVVTITPDTYGEASGEGGPPVWSPDGSLIAFDTLGGIYVMKQDGAGLRRVSRYEGESACYDLEPSWSPDGSRLAFAVLCDGGNEGLWNVNADGSDRSQLLAPTDKLADLSQPVWSPDGTRIAFRGVTRTGSGSGDFEYDIWVMNADGTEIRRLTDGSAFLADPAWSPDGTTIAYTDWTAERVMLINADGSDPRPITAPGIRACCPAWRPVAADGSLTPTPQVDSTQEPITPGSTVTIPLGGEPLAIAAAEGGVWASVANRVAPYEPRLVRIDQTTNKIVATIPLKLPAWDLAAVRGAVWAHGYVQHGPDVLLHVDQATNDVISTIPLYDYVGPLVADATGVWVMTTEEGEDPGGGDDRRRLVRVDAGTNEITASAPIEGYIDEMGLAEGSLWLMRWEAGPGGTERCGPVLRVDPATHQVAEVIPADGLNLAVGPGAAWVSCRQDPEGTFVARRIDPATSSVSEPIPLPGGYGPVGVVESGAWFTGSDDQGRVRVFFLDGDTFEFSGMVTLQAGHFSGSAFDPITDTVWVAHTSQDGSVVRVDLPGPA